MEKFTPAVRHWFNQSFSSATPVQVAAVVNALAKWSGQQAIVLEQAVKLSACQP
ncbi:MAG: hypothetical protein L3J24_02980 [Xanthomonadales bacterium]|nr:hypothetical protein [Xanthomonadales bacterium]